MVLPGSWITIGRIRSARAEKPRIETAKAEIGTVVRSVSATGVLQPLTTIDVKSNAGGSVQSLAVDVGSVVKPGQLIARIDPSDSQTAYNQAEADLTAANARLSQAKEGELLQVEQKSAQIRQSEEAYQAAKARLAQAEAQARVQPTLTQANIKQAQSSFENATETLRQLREAGVPQGTAQAKAAYDQAMASLDKSQRNFERQQGLFKRGFISAGQLDTAELDYKTAKAQAESAKQRMDTVTQDYDSQLRAAEARMEQSRAALESAKANAVEDTLRRQI